MNIIIQNLDYTRIVLHPTALVAQNHCHILPLWLLEISVIVFNISCSAPLLHSTNLTAHIQWYTLSSWLLIYYVTFQNQGYSFSVL